jgi:hypothetical protein
MTFLIKAHFKKAYIHTKIRKHGLGTTMVSICNSFISCLYLGQFLYSDEGWI